MVEKISEIPVTLGDVSESIFGGVNTKNSLLHRLALPEEGGSDSYYLCEGLCKPVFIEPELVYPYVSGAFSEKFAFRSSPYRFMLPYELSGKEKERIQCYSTQRTQNKIPYGLWENYRIQKRILP